MPKLPVSSLEGDMAASERLFKCCKLKDTSHKLAFLKCGLNDQTVIVHTMDLTNNQVRGEVVEYGDKEHLPSSSIAQDDIALYVANEVCKSNLHGKIVHITGK